MGLTNAINLAVTGLHATQDGLSVVSRNVANKDSKGYIRKEAQPEAIISAGVNRGVQLGKVNRQLDVLLQETLQAEGAGAGYSSIVSKYLQRVDLLFGRPGGANALDTVYSKFQGALHDLTTSPENRGVQDNFLYAAQNMAQQLNTMSNRIQDMRREIEQRIDENVTKANRLLQEIADVNASARSSGGQVAPDLLDKRDRAVTELSQLMAVDVTQRADGSLLVRTASGIGLVDGVAEKLTFDHAGFIDANRLYSDNDSQRGVGTIKIKYGANVEVDLIKDGGIRSGELGGLIKLRDELLVTAQGQIDAIAAGIAKAASTIDVGSAAVSAGPQDGFSIDAAGLQRGDTLTLNYKQMPAGTPQTVTFLNTSNPAGLPANGTATAKLGDQVVGIDFNQPIANVVADMQAALGGSFTVSNPAGTTIQILDDGAGNTIDITSLSGQRTQTAVQNGNPAFNLFVDGAAGTAFSGAFEGNPQIRGFANRIRVNSALTTNPQLLTRYSATTPSGDNTRSIQFLKRITEARQDFVPAGGSRVTTPFNGTLSNYVGRVVSFQAGEASAAAQADEAQKLVVNQLNERFSKQAGVDIDVEMTLLINLQQSFQANSRIIQATRELMNELLRI